MKQLLLAVLLVILPSVLIAQCYKSDFEKAFHDGNEEEVTTLLAKWNNARPEDPEMFVAHFNYYYRKSRQELIGMGTQPGKGDNLALLKQNSNEPAGYMYNQIVYDDSLFQLAQYYIGQGIERNPNRLDMHFGRLYSLREAGFLEEHVDGILNVIDVHSKNNGAWLWTDDESVPDAEKVFKGSIQDYNHALFNLSDAPYSTGIEKISLRMMELYPDDIENYSNVGVCRLIEEKYDAALEMFLKAHKLNSGDAIVLSNLAYTHVQLGEKRKAIHYYEEVVRVGDGEMVEFAKSEIEKLKKKK
jgi:tetratricopeptide (TPR) repeat protein